MIKLVELDYPTVCNLVLFRYRKLDLIQYEQDRATLERMAVQYPEWVEKKIIALPKKFPDHKPKKAEELQAEVVRVMGSPEAQQELLEFCRTFTSSVDFREED